MLRQRDADVVEVDGVVIPKRPTRSADGDDSANQTQTGRVDIASPYMKTIRVEIDGTWICAGVAPPPWPRRVGTRLDVQGFVLGPGPRGRGWSRLLRLGAPPRCSLA
jgi:hypothetical protein